MYVLEFTVQQDNILHKLKQIKTTPLIKHTLGYSRRWVSDSISQNILLQSCEIDHPIIVTISMLRYILMCSFSQLWCLCYLLCGSNPILLYIWTIFSKVLYIYISFSPIHVCFTEQCKLNKTAHMGLTTPLQNQSINIIWRVKYTLLTVLYILYCTFSVTSKNHWVLRGPSEVVRSRKSLNRNASNSLSLFDWNMK